MVSRGLWSRPFFFADILNSESVPQSLQEGHWPFHLGKSSPHAEQRYAVFVLILAMAGQEIGYHGKGNQVRFTNLDPMRNTTGV